MYIGPWPELHLAKLVAAVHAGEGPNDVDSTCRRSFSSEPPPSVGGGSQASRCSTPASTPCGKINPLFQVPLVRRVDVFGGGQCGELLGAGQVQRRFDIGPNDLPAACRSHSENRIRQGGSSDNSGNAGANRGLPPLARGLACGSGGRSGRSTPSKAMRHAAPQGSNRVHSQPRLWQPPLRGGGAPSASPQTPRRSPITGTPPPKGLPPGMGGSAPPTPPGACPRARIAPFRPRSAGRAATPPRRLASVGSPHQDHRTVPSGSAVPRDIHRVSEVEPVLQPAALSEAPPWLAPASPELRQPGGAFGCGNASVVSNAAVLVPERSPRFSESVGGTCWGGGVRGWSDSSGSGDVGPPPMLPSGGLPPSSDWTPKLPPERRHPSPTPADPPAWNKASPVWKQQHTEQQCVVHEPSQISDDEGAELNCASALDEEELIAWSQGLCLDEVAHPQNSVFGAIGAMI
eukprot:TRINITY_DN63412_c0_g1_i1.p1 TRINITY_DN63412_c0_g1~~TRINITY_DN63412_c0_g1_i1.p1  ORF type:complete len:460 (+),score=75.14 TRINITY_DN63412_c0_g1_i1:146-1525(+)